jgi:hypothetical protein
MLVSRSKLSALEAERDEWRRRAEASPARAVRQYVVMRGPRWARLLAAVWLVALGVLIAGVAIPEANDRPALRPDYSGCIGKARYEAPITGNQYQELVNALYACGVYEKASTDG